MVGGKLRLHQRVPKRQLHGDAHPQRRMQQALPNPGQLFLYVAGPPCQGLSSAGPRKNWDDQRTRLYMHAVQDPEETQPDIFLLENLDNLRHANHGAIADAIITKDFGLPQNRSRLWIIGIARHTQKYRFQWLEHIPAIPLCQLLVPKQHDAGRPHPRPTSKAEVTNVDAAARYASEHGTKEDWTIAEHCSANFMPNP